VSVTVTRTKRCMRIGIGGHRLRPRLYAERVARCQDLRRIDLAASQLRII